ncbi:hypothetical protein D3C80_399380 [compost metagenome]
MVEQMSSEGMAQGVRRQRFVDAGDPGMVLDAMPEGLAGHLLATLAGEQDIAGATIEQFGAAIAQVALQPHHRLFAHGHQALLAALAHHPQHALAQVDLVEGQADQFGDPQAAGVKHFEHGAVTLADGFAQVRGLQQGFDVGFGQRLGQRLAQLRHVDLQGRVDGHQLFPQQVAEEAAQAGQEACRGAWLVALVEAPGQVVENQVAAGVGQADAVFLQPAVEQGQVAAVGHAGVVGQALFKPQGVEELVDQGVV